MAARSSKEPLPKKEFEPLEIMGVFWVFLGTIVLFSTLFIKATPNVPLIRGVVTNIIAALLLLGIGLASILRGRARKKRTAGKK
ncbi:MAG: hypothetical protein ACE5LC_06720 [Candidatus Aminicenantales bacterium]